MMWVLIGLGVLMLLHVVTSFAPGLESWGVNYWSDISLVWRLGFVVLVVICFIPRLAASIAQEVSQFLASRLARAAAVVALGIIMFVFRMDALAYGDGYSFLGYFEDGNMPTIGVHLSTQYFDLLAHWVVYRVLVMPLGGDIPLAYALVASVAGMLSVWALIRIARALSTDRAVRGLVIAAAMASGAMVLFFGHVESYALANVSLLWTIVFLLEARSRCGLLWAAWGCWVAAVAFHQLAFVTLPGMIWATIRVFRPRETSSNRDTIGVTFALGFIAWLAATVLYRMIGPPLFVPVFATPDSQYTAFSPTHLLDQFNLLLFLAPVGVVALVGWLVKREQSRPHPRLGTVVAIAASAWMFSFWIDPLIGAFRDWDLLAAFALPMSIWAGYYIAHWFPKSHPPHWVWVPVAAVAIAHVGGFVVSAQNEMTVVTRVDRLIHQDPHYAANYFEGSRLPPWGTVLAKELGRPDLAKSHLHKAVQGEPQNATRWANLGNAYENLGQNDSARIAYESAVEYDSTNAKYLRNLAILQQETGAWEDAIHTTQRLLAVGDSSYDQMCTLGMLYAQAQRFDDALSTLEQAKSMIPESGVAWYYAGQVYQVMADTANAVEQLQGALERGAEQKADIYQRLVQMLQWSGRRDEAIAIAREWEREFPRSGSPPFLLGTVWYQEEQYDSAQAALMRAFHFTPQSATLHFYLGSVQRNRGQWDSARAHLHRAAELNQNMAIPFLELVYLYADQGDHESAKEAAQRYLQRAPQDSSMDYLQRYLD